MGKLSAPLHDLKLVDSLSCGFIKLVPFGNTALSKDTAFPRLPRGTELPPPPVRRRFSSLPRPIPKLSPTFPRARATPEQVGETARPPEVRPTGLAWRAFFGRRCKFGKKGGKSVGRRRRAEGSSYLPSFSLPSEHKMDVEI